MPGGEWGRCGGRSTGPRASLRVWGVRLASAALVRCFAAPVLAQEAVVGADDDAGGWIPERRRAQCRTDLGYAVFPYPYSLPGIGAGLRVVTASGVVFRGDVATGEEGVQYNLFIGYPWEL